MGYTHYWRQNREQLDPKKWEMLRADAERLCAAFQAQGNELIGTRFVDDSVPKFESDLIIFNGKGSDGLEDFKLRRFEGEEATYLQASIFKDDRILRFCKTAAKPYDLLVTSVLMLFKHYFKSKVQVKTDGWAIDWLEARQFIERTLGVSVSYRMLETKSARELLSVSGSGLEG